MATKYNINGKLVTRPGVYTLTKSGIQNAPVTLSYGNVAIIDDGIGAGWGGGNGKQAYTFNTIQDFRNFVKGGPLYDLAQPLFKPVPNKDIQGVSSITLIQARDTTAAAITFTLTNGTLTLTPKDQGVNANGVITSGDLRQGYGAKLIAGTVTDTYVLQIFHGSYKGLDPLNNTPYDGVLVANSGPIKITESPAFADLNALKAWLDADANTQQGFTVALTGVTNSGDLVSGDASNSYVLASGGTETYSGGALTTSQNIAKDVDVNFFFAMKYGNPDVTHANNLAILSNVIIGAKYERFLFVVGGATAAELDSLSIPAAVTYNSDKVILSHGDGLTSVRGSFKQRSQLWKGAGALGRLAGLEPQAPLTFKSVGIDAEPVTSQLDASAQERALAKGILVSYFDTELGYEVFLEDINTLQTNDYLVNDDGSSFNIAIRRITAQLNKEAAIYLKRKFFGSDTQGPNRNTVSEEDLIAAMQGFLQSKTATTTTDNLIIAFANITATVTSDTYVVNYDFEPNFEVSKIIITGRIVDKI